MSSLGEMPLTFKQQRRLEELREEDDWKDKYKNLLESWRHLLLEGQYELGLALLAYDYGDHLCCQDKDFSCFEYSLTEEGCVDFGPGGPDEWKFPEDSAYASGRVEH